MLKDNRNICLGPTRIIFCLIFLPDRLQIIVLMSWADHRCGGWPSIELKNPDGTHCETAERSLSAGDTLVWSLAEGLKNCSNMVVTQNTTLYIKTSSGDDLCPKNVFIFPTVGPVYTTGDIYTWYDYYKTNGRKHRLLECRTVRPVEQQRRRRRRGVGSLIFHGLSWLRELYDLIGDVQEVIEWAQTLGIIPESDVQYECIE